MCKGPINLKKIYWKHGHIGKLAHTAAGSKRYMPVVQQTLPTPYVSANTTLKNNFGEAVKILKDILGEDIVYCYLYIQQKCASFSSYYNKIYEDI